MVLLLGQFHGYEVMAVPLFATRQREVEGWTRAQWGVIGYKILSFRSDDGPDFGSAGFEDMSLDTARIDDFRRLGMVRIVVVGRSRHHSFLQEEDDLSV